MSLAVEEPGKHRRWEMPGTGGTSQMKVANDFSKVENSDLFVKTGWEGFLPPFKGRLL